MADQADIFTVRLKISDPGGYIALIEATSLPSAPAHQTAYLYDGTYYATDKTSSATMSDYDPVDLRLSDSVIGGYIDDHGLNSAVCYCIKQLIAALGMEMRVKSLSGGTDTTEYQSLADMTDFYNDLLTIYSDIKDSEDGTDTGRMFKTRTPEIGGGNL